MVVVVVVGEEGRCARTCCGGRSVLRACVCLRMSACVKAGNVAFDSGRDSRLARTIDNGARKIAWN